MDYEPTFVIGDMLNGEERFAESFISMSVLREYTSGHILVRQGEQIRNLFLILNGTVECSFFSESGQKKIITLNKGRWFFGASSIDNNPYTMNYICLTQVRAAVMPPSRICDWASSMLLTLAKLQKNKERILNRQLQLRAFNSADERVLSVLCDLAHVNSVARSENCNVGRITQQTLSEIVGATRVQVSKALKKYADMGLIIVDGKNNIFLTDKCQVVEK